MTGADMRILRSPKHKFLERREELQKQVHLAEIALLTTQTVMRVNGIYVDGLEEEQIAKPCPVRGAAIRRLRREIADAIAASAAVVVAAKADLDSHVATAWTGVTP